MMLRPAQIALGRRRGMTLIEVAVAMAILGVMGILAFIMLLSSVGIFSCQDVEVPTFGQKEVKSEQQSLSMVQIESQ